MTYLVWIAFVILFLTWFYLQRKWRFSLFTRLGIPGPTPSLLTGNLPELIAKGSAAVFDEWTRKYGKLVGFYNGAYPMLMVMDLELIKKILIKDFGNFHERGMTSPVTQAHPQGRKALTSNAGDQWKQMRSLTTPAFTTTNMRKMFQQMEQCSEELLHVLTKRMTDGEAIEMREIFQRMTMDVIVRSVFGLQSNVQRLSDDNLMDDTRKESLKAIAQFRTAWIHFFCSCFPELSFLWKCIATFRTTFWKFPRDKVVDRMIPIIEMRRSNPEARRDDLLQNMLDAAIEDGAQIDLHKLEAQYDDDISVETTQFKGKGKARRFLSNAEIQSNAFVFLLAGFETTSGALSFTSYLLAKHQDVQNRLREEIMSTLRKDGKFTYNNVFTMRYLDQVTSESLRIFPPVVGFTTRMCQQEYRHEDLVIPAGMSIVIPTMQLHHDESLWDDPDKFDPERFSAENKGKIPPMAFQPFGNGPRNCVGLRFAQLELKLALCKLLAKFKLHLDDRHIKEKRLSVGSSFILSYPQNGVWLKLEQVST